MDNDFQKFEKALTSKDIAAMIGIAESTVRKYAAALEDAGYPFTKDGDGEKAPRIFTESDAMVMRHLKELREKSNLPVEQAAQLISAKHPKGTLQIAASNAIAPITDYNTIINAIHERHDKRFDALEEKINGINKFNEVLLERLDERDDVIRVLQEALAVQKALAATTESTVQQQIQNAVDTALDRHNERLKSDKAEMITYMREQLATKQEIAAAVEEERNKSIWKRIFGK
ncbi:hypothetical protein [Paenibacillus radicis (ex Xue et al. 2023)]|uniref:HTH merR-type domain-containing protein n=1 Tax=Paenibacillus radicis (ex Xue et al. 2023) TaxID=2972489 RepID=A0ABT1YVJ0_9BACL|nr:hypothetical protein [Paenibacillus radicis (ex Xue et al. 2023)]MCR8636958.1 hypothetical protein [Paenibacillus radicis (ex Xue et al. 2023)]